MNWADRIRPLRRVAGPIESAQVRRFGRSALSVLLRAPVLVLESVGRRSGAVRSTTLAYRPVDGDSWLVVAGAGGQSRTADWVHNLRASPDVTVTVDRERVPVHAVELTGDERVASWAELQRAWPKIDAYERRAGYTIPVFRLERREH